MRNLHFCTPRRRHFYVLYLAKKRRLNSPLGIRTGAGERKPDGMTAANKYLDEELRKGGQVCPP
jgi:hypothetical protein